MLARAALVSLSLLLVLALSGCPKDGKGTTDGTAEVTSGGVPLSGKISKPGHATPTPAASSGPVKEDKAFPKATLFEIFRAEQLGTDAERTAVEKKHGLLDAQGKEDQDRVSAYEAALKAFSESRPDEWSAFVDEIEAARARK